MRPGQQGGPREEGAERGPGRPPSPHLPAAGPGPTVLIRPASQTLPQFPVPCPPDAQSHSQGRRWRGADFPLGICIHIFFFFFFF